jgi:hypothetical protein
MYDLIISDTTYPKLYEYAIQCIMESGGVNHTLTRQDCPSFTYRDCQITVEEVQRAERSLNSLDDDGIPTLAMGRIETDNEESLYPEEKESNEIHDAYIRKYPDLEIANKIIQRIVF